MKGRFFLVPSSIWDQIQNNTWSNRSPAPEYWAWLFLESRKSKDVELPSVQQFATILGWSKHSACVLLEKYKQFNEDNP